MATIFSQRRPGPSVSCIVYRHPLTSTTPEKNLRTADRPPMIPDLRRPCARAFGPSHAAFSQMLPAHLTIQRSLIFSLLSPTHFSTRFLADHRSWSALPLPSYFLSFELRAQSLRYVRCTYAWHICICLWLLTGITNVFFGEDDYCSEKLLVRRGHPALSAGQSHTAILSA